MKNLTTLLLLCIGVSSVFAQEATTVPTKLSLQEAIDYAIKNNYDNKIAAKNIEAAK